MDSAFFWRMATRVSESGGSNSAVRPHSKRETRRVSRLLISDGGRSLERTICLCPSKSALKVWKNSSCDRSLPARNWMSSISSTSVFRYRLRNFTSDVVLNRVDELVRETLAREVEHLQALFAPEDLVADGVHEVGLAQADPAVDEERIVGLRRGLTHAVAGGMGKLVVRADDERLEGVPKVYSGFRGHSRRRRFLWFWMRPFSIGRRGGRHGVPFTAGSPKTKRTARGLPNATVVADCRRER